MIIRWLYIIHRYAGVVLGPLMLMWCLSGIVVMYVAYPTLLPKERAAGLVPISWAHCCTVPAFGADSAVTQFDVEMLAGKPVMRFRRADQPGETKLVDLETGKPIESVTATDARGIGLAYARGHGLGLAAPQVEKIARDQWTVSGSFDPDRPLYRVALGDRAGTEIYVSSLTGVVVQKTTASQRFWNYLGAVPHWLYFTQLRKDTDIWVQVVTWTSLAGGFLALTGIYIGIRQFLRAQRAKRWSPYRGFLVWHHVPGTLFGILVLTWVVSGMLSVNPWGLLEGSSGEAKSEQLLGAPIPASELTSMVKSLPAYPLPGNVVSLQSASLNGRLYLVATSSNGVRERLDAAGRAAPLNNADMAFIAATLAGKGPHSAVTYLPNGDNYYFSHDEDFVPTPIDRLIVPAASVRYYFDPVTGVLVQKTDDSAKGFRWLQQGFHRMDFTSTLRSHPIWDILMLGLMFGVTFAAGTGTYLSIRYLFRGRYQGSYRRATGHKKKRLRGHELFTARLMSVVRHPIAQLPVGLESRIDGRCPRRMRRLSTGLSARLG